MIDALSARVDFFSPVNAIIVTFSLFKAGIRVNISPVSPE
jgi:hypothetical protein